ncbi:MAG: FAD-dependent oxidoreductase [Pseudomonadota bacterium]
MHIAVIGAGVAGATTADALQRAGHRVTVFERAASAGQGASQANGAQLSYSYCDAMASPALLLRLPSALLGRDRAMRARLRLNGDFLRWGLAFAASSRHFQRHTDALHALARASAEIMAGYHERFGSAYRYRRAGKLVLLPALPGRDEQARLARKQRSGIFIDVLDVPGTIDREPALAQWQGAFAAALYAPGDEVGDAQAFASTLLTQLEAQGVELRWQQAVERVTATAGDQLEIAGPGFAERFDRAVLCTAQVPRSLGPRLRKPFPVYPVTGYSLTLPATDQSTRVSVTDLSAKLVFSRLGEDVRIAGYADINLPPNRQRRRCDALLQHARRLGPSLARWEDEPQRWIGHRPMTPSSLPHIGATATPGLFINLGHGMLGWTLAAGSAARVCALVNDSRPTTVAGSFAAEAPQHG